jgi:hypothetical protein
MIIKVFFPCQVSDTLRIDQGELYRMLLDAQESGQNLSGSWGRDEGKIVNVSRAIAEYDIPIGCNVDIEINDPAWLERNIFSRSGDFTIGAQVEPKASELGQIGYESYGATGGWKTFDGRPMPSWDELGRTDTGRDTRRRWEIAARAIRGGS